MGSTHGERKESTPAPNATANVMDPSMSAPDKLKRLRRRLFRFYYSLKYFPFTGERKHRPEREERGFIVIQADALSHADLQTVIEKGYAKNLRRLLYRDG